MPGLPCCRLPMGAATIYETGLEAKRPELVVAMRLQMAARVETRLRSRLRLSLRSQVEMTKRDVDVYVTVPTREANGSALDDPCAPLVKSGYSCDELQGQNEIVITIHCRELPKVKTSKPRWTDAQSREVTFRDGSWKDACRVWFTVVQTPDSRYVPLQLPLCGPRAVGGMAPPLLCSALHLWSFDEAQRAGHGRAQTKRSQDKTITTTTCLFTFFPSRPTTPATTNKPTHD